MPPDTPQLPPPAHVKLGCWAVAGGAVGCPVHLVFRDYPVWLIAEFYARLVRWVGPGHAVYLHSERDLRLLEEKLGGHDTDTPPRLVLLTDPKLIERVSWILASRRPDPATGTRATPALLTTQPAPGRGDLPGPVLSLDGSSSQVQLATSWLDAGRPFDPFPAEGLAPGVSFGHLDEVFGASARHPGRRPLRHPDKQVLQGLLAGAAFLRLSRTQVPAEITVGWEDYRAVYDPLRLVATQPADAAFEPLTLFMVRRANVYLGLRSAKEAARPAVPDTQATSSNRRVTRRELADLGNTRGRTVRALVKELYATGEQGLADFKTLGTNRPLTDTDPWPASDPGALAGVLLGWTVKQVRTHFERLHAEGFVTGSRGSANQPWVYQLPEALADPDSPFKALPPPDTLELPPPAPACPPPRADRTPWPGGDSGRNTPVGPTPGESG